MIKIIRTGHRDCSDAEYAQQRRCWECHHYSFKAFADEDHNSGKCFVQCTPGDKDVLYTEGKNICDQFKHQTTEDDR